MLTKDMFVQKSKIIHGEKYDYTNTVYVNTKTPVSILCPIHGCFYQTPHDHFKGSGCKKCAFDKLRFSTTDFVERSRFVHGDKYDYSLVNYTNTKSKVKIVCKKCSNVFSQKAMGHLQGQGCPECDDATHRNSLNDFIEKAKEVHGDRYDYSNVDYISGRNKVQIKCNRNGHVFYQTPRTHLLGAGCRYCRYKNEYEVGEILKKAFPDWKIYSHKMLWKTYGDYSTSRFCDFMMERNGVKVVVEYDGRQHFQVARFYGITQQKAEENFRKQQMIDALDAQFCHDNGILLFRIKYSDNKQARIEELSRAMQSLLFRVSYNDKFDKRCEEIKQSINDFSTPDVEIKDVDVISQPGVYALNTNHTSPKSKEREMCILDKSGAIKYNKDTAKYVEKLLPILAKYGYKSRFDTDGVCVDKKGDLIGIREAKSIEAGGSFTLSGAGIVFAISAAIKSGLLPKNFYLCLIDHQNGNVEARDCEQIINGRYYTANNQIKFSLNSKKSLTLSQACKKLEEIVANVNAIAILAANINATFAL